MIGEAIGVPRRHEPAARQFSVGGIGGVGDQTAECLRAADEFFLQDADRHDQVDGLDDDGHGSDLGGEGGLDAELVL